MAWELDSEKKHAAAGFPKLSHDLIVRRYFQFLRFLQDHGMTTRIVCGDIGEITDESEWKNSDLTEDGFYFVQRFHGRWLDRTHKDQGEEKEETFLIKWLKDYQNKKVEPAHSANSASLRGR